MKDELADAVVGIVALNGGQIISKTRLQKTIYLLQEVGIDIGANFEFHHFGPFSFEIAEAAEEAGQMGRLKMDARPGYHLEPYVVFSTDENEPGEIFGERGEDIKEKLDILKRYSALELEVAGILEYLWRNGYGDNAEDEARIRKPVKATDSRIARAKVLLRELGLQ